jgi:hypothetical protein
MPKDSAAHLHASLKSENPRPNERWTWLLILCNKWRSMAGNARLCKTHKNL